VEETAEQLAALQGLLDRSATGAGAHLRSIVTDERRLSAAELSQRLLRAGLGPHAPPGRAARGQRHSPGRPFETWLNEVDAVAARIAADKMFTFALDD
jgi:hypothetical protein